MGTIFILRKPLYSRMWNLGELFFLILMPYIIFEHNRSSRFKQLINKNISGSLLFGKSCIRKREMWDH